MHPAAMDWMRQHAATDEPVSVLDIGGRNINGSCRELFPKADPYIVLDARPGDEVDIHADASTWTPDRSFDVVLAAEVFEHTPVWPGICVTAYKALAPGGLFAVTTAGPGRQPHSGIDGGRVRPGEHYANLTVDELADVLEHVGFVDVLVERCKLDVRAICRRS